MIYLILVIIIGVISACIQNYFCKNLFKNESDNLKFETVVYLVALISTVFTVKLQRPSAYCVMLAVINGCLLTLENYAILEAMRCGSMSLTSLFSLAALIIPVVVSPFLWHEVLTAAQLSGSLLTVISMAFILDVFSGKNGINKRWLLFAFLAFLAGGSCAICEKYLIASPYADQTNTYAVISFTVVIASTLILQKVRKEKALLKLTKKNLLPLIFIGGGSAAIFLLTIAALKVLTTSGVYATNNGARLMLVTLCDVFVFKQKLSKSQIAGMVMGLLAIILLSV